MKKSDIGTGGKLPRRTFFTKIMHAVIAAGLTGATGYLLLKEKREEACSLDFTCTLCGKTEQCGLPAAESFRRYERQKKEQSRARQTKTEW